MVPSTRPDGGTCAAAKSCGYDRHPPEESAKLPSQESADRELSTALSMAGMRIISGNLSLECSRGPDALRTFVTTLAAFHCSMPPLFAAGRTAHLDTAEDAAMRRGLWVVDVVEDSDSGRQSR